MIFYIYKHTSPSGKVYIGQTCRKPEKRWGIEGKLYKSSPNFYSAILKYGWDNIKHDIVQTTDTQEKADILEQMWISFYKRRTGVYNLTDGGEHGSRQGHPLSEKARKEASERMKRSNPMFNEEYKRKSIKSRRYQTHPPMSDYYKNMHSERMKFSNPSSIKEVHQRAMQTRSQRFSITEDYGSKKKRKKVYCYDTLLDILIEYNWVMEAVEKLKIGKSTITDNIANKSNLVKKRYKFSYDRYTFESLDA